MDDVPTLTPPESPPVVDEGTPASQGVVTPPSELAPLGEAAETPEEETPPPPAWATVQEAEEVLELEDMKPILERRDQVSGDRAYELLKGHMQPLLQGNKQTLEQIAAASETIVTTLNRAVEDGALDKRTVEDLMRTHRSEFAALNQTYQATGYWEGVKQYTQALLGNDAPQFLTRLEKMQQSIPDPTFAADIQKKVREAGRKEGYDEGFRKGGKQGQTAAQQKAAIEGAKGTGANLAPGSPAGGTKKYKDLTSDERKAMSHTDVDAMLARERGER